MSKTAKLERYLQRYVEQNDLNYEDLSRVFSRTRETCGLARSRSGKRLPRLLTEAQLTAFFTTCRQTEDPKWEVFFRLLLATAVRVAEIVAIQIRDVDLPKNRIFIEQGKGDQDHYAPFPHELGLPLRQLMRHNRLYLFESPRGGAYTTRAINKKMAKIATAAGIVDDEGKTWVSPHLFRHQTLTFLMDSGMDIMTVKKISGHESVTSLEVYEHLALKIPHQIYQEIMAGTPQLAGG